MSIQSVFCCSCGRYCGEARQAIPDIKCDNCKDGAITVDQLKEAVKVAGLERINIRQCSLTQEWLFYLVKDKHLLWYGGSGYDARPWEDLAYTINMQKTVDIKNQMLIDMGLGLQVPL